MNRTVLAQAIRRCYLTAASVSALVTTVVRAEDTAVLDTVVVEGDRVNVIPTEPLESVFGFGKTVMETPRSVTTISNEMLSKVMITEIDDLVALTPGSFTQSFFGVAGSLDVRGTPGENYFRGMKRIDNPGNYPTPIGASDRIDVVRGPASPIYGPSKIGGYLNFIPKSARANTGQYLPEARGEMGITSGSWDKKVIHAEVGGPADIGSKTFGYYLYGEFENSGSYYDNSETDQSIYQASFDVNLTDTVRLEFGGMYQDFKGNQVAGWNRLTQDLIDHGTYITGSPPSLDTNGDGLLSNAEADAGNLLAIFGAPATATDIQSELATHPNMALVNPGTTHIDGSTVLTQDDDALQAEVVTLYFDAIFGVSDGFKITNKVFYESLDNNNENAYGFSQYAKTWAAEDQLIFAYSTPALDSFQGNFQFSPSIRHQDFEHGDDFFYEYFDRRDITLPGSPIDRRTLATRGQDPYSNNDKGKFDDYAGAFLADMTFFRKLNVLGAVRLDYLDMESRSLAYGNRADDTDDAFSWSTSVSYELPFGLRPYATFARQSTLILGQGGQIPVTNLAAGNAIGDSKLEEYGIKASLLDSKLYLALDYFDQDRVDFAAQDPVTNNSTQARGIEFEARWVVTPNVTLTGAYTNLKVYNIGAIALGKQFSFAGAEDLLGVNPALMYGGVSNIGGFDGAPVTSHEAGRKAGIPENVLSVYALFSFDGMLDGLTGSIGVVDVDSVYSGISHTVKLPSYTLANASVYYETKSWKLGLQGKNLTDERYFRSNFPDLFGTAVVLPELPRNYLISASYRF